MLVNVALLRYHTSHILPGPNILDVWRAVRVCQQLILLAVCRVSCAAVEVTTILVVLFCLVM